VGLGHADAADVGGIVTLLNFIPYLGPIGAVLLLGVGGSWSFPIHGTRSCRP
jgi:predicted PurR-regulated permease PerM